jgi:hypothetical protein
MSIIGFPGGEAIVTSIFLFRIESWVSENGLSKQLH